MINHWIEWVYSIFGVEVLRGTEDFPARHVWVPEGVGVCQNWWNILEHTILLIYQRLTMKEIILNCDDNWERSLFLHRLYSTAHCHSQPGVLKSGMGRDHGKGSESKWLATGCNIFAMTRSGISQSERSVNPRCASHLVTGYFTAHNPGGN